MIHYRTFMVGFDSHNRVVEINLWDENEGMKAIYINRNFSNKKNRKLTVLMVFVVLLLLIRMVLPYGVESVINKKGSDAEGYAFRVRDVDISLLKFEIIFHGVQVFNRRTENNFLETEMMSIGFNPFHLLTKEQIVFIRGGDLNITLSNDLLEEVGRIKDGARFQRANLPFIEHLKFLFDEVNLRQIKLNSTQTIFSMVDAQLDLENMSLYHANSSSVFHLTTKIVEGGNIDISGRTKIVESAIHWIITGKMNAITFPVLDKLAGDKFPLEISETHFNAKISAESHDGRIDGFIIPSLKEITLRDDKKRSISLRSSSDTKKFSSDKQKSRDDFIDLQIPFTLRDALNFNFREMIEKLR